MNESKDLLPLLFLEVAADAAAAAAAAAIEAMYPPM